jgi:hypothetical protein
VFQRASPPQGNFGTDALSQELRSVAMAMPVFKAMGLPAPVLLEVFPSLAHFGQRQLPLLRA